MDLHPYHPKVCMDPKVHYTTQSSVYDRLALGFLVKKEGSKTNRSPKPKRAERRIGKQIAFDLLKELGI